MTVEEAEKCVGWLAVFDSRDYSFSGSVYIISSAWREVSRSCTHDYGVELKVYGSNSVIQTKACHIKLVPYMYDNLKYEADAEAEISPKEALDLLGKNVIYEGKKKMLRRLYKTVSDRKTIVYDVEVQ